MSRTTTYACDHCGKPCSREFEFLLFGEWARKDAKCTPDGVHGCSREHTVLAVAKLMGFEHGKAIARIAELEGEIANLTGPKKPTKPLVEPRCECGHLVSEHIQIENGKGWLHCDGALRLYE